jgi:hypothetical protein
MVDDGMESDVPFAHLQLLVLQLVFSIIVELLYWPPLEE